MNGFNMRACLFGRSAKTTSMLAAAASVAFLAAAPAAWASTVTYEFIPGTTLSLAGGTGTLTGNFTWNTTTFAMSAINVTLSGTTGFAATYDYNYAPWNYASGFGLMHAANSASDNIFAMLFLQFARPLDGAPRVVDYLVGLTGYNLPGTYSGSDLSGGVEVTPLPAALPLFAGGLGVIGVLARRRKRKQA